ncbi:MAG: DNA-binding protein, partial [Clostridia bacterium]|nr:DNA-binding protein [Clostridia bacterium]
MKTHVFRLHRGEDLLLAIKGYCNDQAIDAGVVLSGVGCVTQARVRDASGINLQSLQEHLEIVSLNGTVSRQRCHL